MKTAAQLRDMALYDQAQANVAEALKYLPSAQLLEWAISLMESDDPLAPFALYGLLTEYHRREQADV